MTTNELLASSGSAAGRQRFCLHLPTLTAVLIAVASGLVLTLAGCASSAGIGPTVQPLAASAVGLASPEAGPADAAAMPPPIAADWWSGFGDPALGRLIDQALAANPNLETAQARLARAEAATGGARASQGPRVDGALDLTRQRFSDESTYPSPLGGSIRNLATLQANGSWEIDFFGRQRAALEAALGNQRAAAADLQAARVLLASNVARSYFQLARLVEQRDIARRSLEQRGEVLGLIQQRVRGGLDTNVELRQGEGALPETRQQIEQLEEQIASARHALAALTVQPADALDALTPALGQVQTVPLPARLPTDLVGRRADISAARWRVEAATQDVAAARAEFYPNVSLTAFIGLASIGFDNLVKSGSEQYGVGPAIRLPIFDAGRLRANLRGRNADLDAAVASYNGVVVDAVRDAADRISSLQSIGRQQAEQARAQAAAESAYDLATQRFRAGLATYLTVLNAETQLLAQRRLAADLKARALDAQVGLIHALGGGYAAEADTPLIVPRSDARRG